MKIAVVDIETTGFFNQGGLIVEIGIVELDLETGNVEPLYNSLVLDSKLSINDKDSWIFNNSDLLFSEVLMANPLDLDILQDIFNKYPATAYNKAFDFQFLKDKRLKIKELPCPMLLSTDVIKLTGRYGNYKWPSVQEAWNYFFPNSSYVERHRGFDDAYHEAYIVYELHKLGKFKIDS